MILPVAVAWLIFGLGVACYVSLRYGWPDDRGEWTAFAVGVVFWPHLLWWYLRNMRK